MTTTSTTHRAGLRRPRPMSRSSSDAIVPAYRRGRGRCGLARRCRPGPKHHPARHRGDPRLQPPCAAPAAVPRGALRRLHGLRQRVPGQRPHREGRARGGRRSPPSPASPPRIPPAARPRRTSRHSSPGRRSTPRSRSETASRPAQFGLFVEPDPLQGLRRVCRGMLGARARRPVHDRQGRAATPDRASTIDRAATMIRFLRSLPPTPDVYRNDKALADLMLGEHAFGYVGGAGSCAGCGEATAIRMMVAATRQVHGPDVDGHRRRDRLQHRLRQHLPVQPVPRPVDELAVRERPGGGRRDPAAVGPDGPPGSSAVGHGRRRGDVRHRLPGAVPDGRVRCGHQGPRPGHAGLLEHRRPGLDRIVRRAGHQAVRVRGRPARPPRGAQGAGTDPHGARRRLCRPDDAGAREPLLSGDPGGQRVPRSGRDHQLRRVHAGARHRRRRRQPPGAAGRRLARVPVVHLRPATRPAHQRSAVAAGQPGDPRGLVDHAGRRAGRLPVLRPERGPVRAALRSRQGTDGGDPGDQRRIASRTGARSRSWRASDRLAESCTCDDAWAAPMLSNRPSVGRLDQHGIRADPRILGGQ